MVDITSIVEALGSAFELANTALSYLLERRGNRLDFQKEQDAGLLGEIVEFLPESFIQTLERPMSAERFPSAMFDVLYAFTTDLAERGSSQFYDDDLQEKYADLVNIADAYTEFLSDAAPLGDGFHSIFDDPAADYGYYDENPDEAEEVEEGFQTGRQSVAECYRDLLEVAREKCLDWAD